MTEKGLTVAVVDTKKEQGILIKKLMKLLVTLGYEEHVNETVQDQKIWGVRYVKSREIVNKKRKGMTKRSWKWQDVTMIVIDVKIFFKTPRIKLQFEIPLSLLQDKIQGINKREGIDIDNFLDAYKSIKNKMLNHTNFISGTLTEFKRTIYLGRGSSLKGLIISGIATLEAYFRTAGLIKTLKKDTFARRFLQARFDEENRITSLLKAPLETIIDSEVKKMKTSEDEEWEIRRLV